MIWTPPEKPKEKQTEGFSYPDAPLKCECWGRIVFTGEMHEALCCRCEKCGKGYTSKIDSLQGRMLELEFQVQQMEKKKAKK